MATALDLAAKTHQASELTGLNSRLHAVRLTDGRGAAMAVWVPSALRRVPESRMRKLVARKVPPTEGQIVVAQVEKIGKNARLELPNGRARTLHAGDRIAVVFGNRYATNQFEGYARAEGDACEMLSMGGLCGLVVSAHVSMKEPTKLRLLGSLADADGEPLYMRDFAMTPVTTTLRPQATAVCGTTMDAGKTHTALSVLRGLVQAGRTVAAIKLTGTACCQDTWKMRDAGATLVFDFVDGGHASTYLCSIKDLTTLFETLRSHAAAAGVQHIVVEIADGLLQRETAALLSHRAFVEEIDAWVLAASDPLGVVGALPMMRRAGIEPVVVSGLLTCSPLAMREAEAATGVRCMTAEALMMGALNGSLIASEAACACKEVVA